MKDPGLKPIDSLAIFRGLKRVMKKTAQRRKANLRG
jgi:hypothetical protein